MGNVILLADKVPADLAEFFEPVDTQAKHDVFTISTVSYKGSHFAVFPPNLVLPCILAGTSQKGVCPACGAPWKRKLEKERKATRPGTDTKTAGQTAAVMGNSDPSRHVTSTKTIGWEPSCQCDAGPPIPATVLDPFAGSCTTGMVAIRRGRRFIGIELNPKYAKLGIKRLRAGEHSKGFGLG